jgi:hypothetical protein
MSAQLDDAFEDLTARNAYPPPDLYDRFLSWIHRGGPDPPEGDAHTNPTDSTTASNEPGRPADEGNPPIQPPAEET